MITVEILGGLGNQLFRYAAGRSLAEKHKTNLLLDLSHFKNYRLRSFELDSFKVKGTVRHTSNFFSRILSASSDIFFTNRIYREKHYHFDPGFYDLRDGTYLRGYFQSEKYFISIAAKLKNELTLKSMTLTSKKLLKEITTTHSVSVHVRRGDFIDNPETQNLHGVCSPEYFQKAFNIIGKKVNKPRYYFFSDDIFWVKKNLRVKDHSIYMDGNQGSPAEDLILMSRCKHNIIVNSTFGWWSAWLNPHPHKIVISPKKWYVHEPYDTEDLLPDKWIKI